MAEQDKKISSKLRKIDRVLKWIDLGLLIFLLIAALFFRAPWKVIALLLIIIAVCTVLPKPYRKWFWLSVAAIVLMLIIWIFLPDDNEGWRPYTFVEELAALEAKYAIPDSENAATIYNNLLEGYDFDTMLADFLDPNLENLTRCEPWSSENYPELAKWLEERKYIIEKLLEASKFEKCRFPIVTEPWSLSQSTHQATKRLWAKLLIRAANNDLADGRINEAIEKNLAIFQMAKHQYQHPMATDLLVALAIEAFATKQCNKFVVNDNAEEEHLNIFEKAVADIKHGWDSDITRILECEKLMAKNMMCGMAYEIHSDGRTRFSRDPAAAMRS
ncbi:MAG: hypothetical protein OEW48_21175, partial [Phycisphaerae bacterium]|nr:hypothetical protein [Phycisphaerae bacterium]